MKRILAFAALLSVLLVSCGRKQNKDIEEEKDWPLGFRTDTLFVKESKVESGEVFYKLFTRLGMPGGDVVNLTKACGEEFDVRKLRAGNRVDAWYAGDTLAPKLRYMVYERDRINSTVFQCYDSLAVWNVAKQVDTVRKYTDVTIKSSLWNDMIAAGASPLLILELADVYAWTVDFFGLHEGDRFRAFYRQRVCEDEVIDILGVDFAEYTRGRDTLYAIRYDQGDNGNKYWNQKGESMRKAFLKAPLKFTRISSKFSYHRVHPVHGVVRPHTAVDYAAPSGTPVHALGDGVVLSAGVGKGGAGNMIKIRHNSVYTTGYLHLRGFAKGIKAGVRVAQGQVIGYVGMTGTATGPHLDFRVWKNGTPVDPLKLESPSAEPIKKENLPALDSLYRSYKAEMAGYGN
ncbi:MAG: peptidoglycan DD-metalloendopeptidase family protein [Bacteroidales bacterium]|nr:peptidoglycan DD-metalloendopeptidase family protein [Bacteroidales bacterium]